MPSPGHGANLGRNATWPNRFGHATFTWLTTRWTPEYHIGVVSPLVSRCNHSKGETARIKQDDAYKAREHREVGDRSDFRAAKMGLSPSPDRVWLRQRLPVLVSGTTAKQRQTLAPDRARSEPAKRIGKTTVARVQAARRLESAAFASKAQGCVRTLIDRHCFAPQFFSVCCFGPHSILRYPCPLSRGGIG